MTHPRTILKRPGLARAAMLPVMAAGAMGVAALALVVPIPTPTKPVIAPVEAPKPADPAPAPADETATGESWSALVEPLAKLTDKFEEQPVAAPTEEPTESAEPVQPQQQSSLPPLSWRYKGSIQGPGSMAALVVTGSGSRLVFVGMRLLDETDPGGPGISVKEITSEAVVLDRRGQDVSLPFEPREPTSELGRKFLARSAETNAAPAPARPQ